MAYRLKEFVVSWFTRYAFGSHMSEWLVLAIAILLSFALGIYLLKRIFCLITRERDAGQSESKGEGDKEYWRVHGE